jgi:hypothetical protein
MSEGMQKVMAEVTARYGVLPLFPFDDVWLDDYGRIFLVRVRSRNSKPDEYDVETQRPKRGCKKCYELGYEHILHSNEERFNKHPILILCRCLKHDLEVQKIYDEIVAKEAMLEEADMPCEICQQEKCTCNVIKAGTALPQLKASANFREVAPSGGGSTKASIDEIIEENTIGKEPNV